MMREVISNSRHDKAMRLALLKLRWGHEAEQLADRLITQADLERHLPRELPFRDRTLKLERITQGRILDPRRQCCNRALELHDGDLAALRKSDEPHSHLQFCALYLIKNFFNCHPPVRPWYGQVKLAQRLGKDALGVVEAATREGHTNLGGGLEIIQGPYKNLPAILRRELRAMYCWLEKHIQEELELGCLIRPAANSGRED